MERIITFDTEIFGVPDIGELKEKMKSLDSSPLLSSFSFCPVLCFRVLKDDEGKEMNSLTNINSGMYRFILLNLALFDVVKTTNIDDFIAESFELAGTKAIHEKSCGEKSHVASNALF